MATLVSGNLYAIKIKYDNIIGVDILDNSSAQSITNKNLTDVTNSIRANFLGTGLNTIPIGNLAPTAGQTLVIDGNLSANWNTLYLPEYESVASNGLSTTTGNIFVNKINYTTAIKPAGTYRIGYNYEYNVNVTTSSVVTRVLLDGNIIINNAYEAPRLATGTGFGSNNQCMSTGGFYNAVFNTSSTHTLQLQYRSDVTGTTSACRNARIELHRVS